MHVVDELVRGCVRGCQPNVVFVHPIRRHSGEKPLQGVSANMHPKISFFLYKLKFFTFSI